jgi:Domain of unknown function (DUF4383)
MSTTARSTWQSRSPAQWFCLVGGAALLVRGAVGIALDPVFESPGEGWHQLIHFSSGVLLLAVARDARAALALTLAFATFYAAVTVVGIVDGADVASVIPVETSDNSLHTFLTLTSLAAGLLSLRVRRRPASR